MFFSGTLSLYLNCVQNNSHFYRVTFFLLLSFDLDLNFNVPERQFVVQYRHNDT